MRTPSVFVRDLSPGEGQRLKHMSRTAKYFATRQRAQILLASAAGMAPAQIARALSTDDSHVRKVIKAFNEEGFESLRPRYRGGRPRKVDPESAAKGSGPARGRGRVGAEVVPSGGVGPDLRRWIRVRERLRLPLNRSN
ncbi:MAG: helix-turn-helix domain-containing protein [Actinobacteria bacterium]|nr:helix-turn-helix domain-containing protein [Actinomycetota bacterium]